MLGPLLAAALQAGSYASLVTQPAPPPTPIKPSKIVLVGDSTTAVSGGWGGAFCADHVTSFLACVNLARGGRSSGSYIAEGSWDVALAELRTPGFVHTWVLIQFGHNDEPGKPGRSTDLATQFPANLRRYVTDARAAGAIPVLVTPLTRRAFVDGKLQDDLAPWSAAVRRVAAEMKVPLVDLNARSRAAVQAMGRDAADKFAQMPRSATPAPTAPAPAAPAVASGKTFAQRKLSFDDTHLGVGGATYFAAMMAHELPEAVPDLRPLLFETVPPAY